MDISIIKSINNNNTEVTFSGVTSSEESLVKDVLDKVLRESNYEHHCSGHCHGQYSESNNTDIGTDKPSVSDIPELVVGSSSRIKRTSVPKNIMNLDGLGNTVRDKILVLVECKSCKTTFMQMADVVDGAVTIQCKCGQAHTVYISDLYLSKYTCDCGTVGVFFKTEDVDKVICKDCGKIHYLVLNQEQCKYVNYMNEEE